MNLVNTCSFAGIRPAMVDLPYPPIQAEAANPGYAQLLKIDYCGAVSEMTAITQYINNEGRLSGENCELARTIIGIAMAEMMHLQKLGELICLLGGNLDYTARQRNGRPKMWTPAYILFAQNVKDILLSNIDAERAAIAQYEKHMQKISDPCVNAVLERIIKDEEYHIMMLDTLLRGLS